MSAILFHRIGVSVLAVYLGADYYSSSGFRYPYEIAWAPLEVVASQSVTDWEHTKSGHHILTVDEFFPGGGSLTIDFPLGNGREDITLRGGGTVRFSMCSVPSFHRTHSSQYDFDANGLTDIKFVFTTGGVAGHSNNAYVYYFFQHPKSWHLLLFYVRDPSYTWEADLNGDGKCELLKGHHQDKQLGYHDVVTDKWVSKFNKYLVINAYELQASGLRLCNSMSDELPKILSFKEVDPFGNEHSQEFMDYNQFEVPDGYVYQIQRMRR